MTIQDKSGNIRRRNRLFLLGGLIAVAIVIIMTIFRTPSAEKEDFAKLMAEAETGFTYYGEYVMMVEPLSALCDTPVEIRLSGFAPGQPVTLRTQVEDEMGQTWEALATYAANADGSIDVNTQEPLFGTYTGAEPMGLFWSMRPQGVEKSETIKFAKSSLDPLIITITVEGGGDVLTSAKVERLFVLPESEIVRQPVREEGVVGTLFYPTSPGPHPAVIVLGGSEGGLSESNAALLASRGYATLALAYFRIESLPDALVEIPLEYFENAINWLADQEVVDAERIAVMGRSKGGELALLLGATYPQIKTVVAYVPSAVVWAGLGSRELASSWSVDGTRLDYVTMGSVESWPSLLLRSIRGEPVAYQPGFSKGLENKQAVGTATIPVENINGPVLLISGTDDQVWPSTAMADMVIARLAENEHPYPYEHLSYEGAGHGIRTPYQPTTTREAGRSRMILGGAPQADAFASADSWEKVLAFLEKHLE